MSLATLLPQPLSLSLTSTFAAITAFHAAFATLTLPLADFVRLIALTLSSARRLIEATSATAAIILRIQLVLVRVALSELLLLRLLLLLFEFTTALATAARLIIGRNTRTRAGSRAALSAAHRRIIWIHLIGVTTATTTTSAAHFRLVRHFARARRNTCPGSGVSIRTRGGVRLI